MSWPAYQQIHKWFYKPAGKDGWYQWCGHHQGRRWPTRLGSRPPKTLQRLLESCGLGCNDALGHHSKVVRGLLKQKECCRIKSNTANAHNSGYDKTFVVKKNYLSNWLILLKQICLALLSQFLRWSMYFHYICGINSERIYGVQELALLPTFTFCNSKFEDTLLVYLVSIYAGFLSVL